MKLHHLRLSAIGPFAGTVDVDLAALGASGMFLLEGPTGSGKSTILDAIVYALYGQVAGSATSSDRIRSQFAGPTEPRISNGSPTTAPANAPRPAPEAPPTAERRGPRWSMRASATAEGSGARRGASTGASGAPSSPSGTTAAARSPRSRTRTAAP